MNYLPLNAAQPSFGLGLILVLFLVNECHGQDAEVPSPTSKIPILDTVIESWPVDAAMTRVQEQAIWAKLCQPYTPIATRIALDDWVDSLSPICPIEMDWHALEEFGVGRDVEIQFQLGTLPKPLLVQALAALKQIDCVIEVRHGVVSITTQYDAEDNLAVRIYDASTLAGGGDPHQKLVAMKFLIDTIETVIEPDDWERLGGTSTIQLIPMKHKKLLCVATRTQTHWKLQAFLDQLQRVGGEAPAPRSIIPSPTQIPELNFQPKSKSLTPQPRPQTELPRFRPE